MQTLKETMIAFALLLGLGIQSAQATLIDQGDTTFDDTNGLEWLDLTFTDNKSVDTAIATYASAGWRVATEAEYQAMFDSYFTSGYVSNSNGYMQVSAGSTLYDQGLAFVQLFGLTYSYAALNVNAAYGFYLEGNIVRLGGVYEGSSWANLHRDNIYDYSSYQTTPHINAGVFMVRNVSVPEAPSLAMLALGLLSLGFIRRKS